MSLGSGALVMKCSPVSAFISLLVKSLDTLDCRVRYGLAFWREVDEEDFRTKEFPSKYLL
jgi:hypothetical protein